MDTPLPQFTDGIDLRYFVEGYSGPTHPKFLLDRFPDSVYSKSPDSHFMRFMYALLGPTGVGWLRLALLLGRLQYEAAGTTTRDLEAAYGNPFSLARNIEESYADFDLSGLLPASVWQQIQAQDESYRTRAMAYLSATRLGCTPEGMALAASSGTGQQCEVVENYKHLFDEHSDDPLGYVSYGQTLSTNEFIVVPRVPVSKTVQQIVKFPSTDAGAFKLSYNGYSTPTLSATSTASQVQAALEALGVSASRPLLGNVIVTGGPQPNAFILTFTGALSNSPVYAISAKFTDGTVIEVLTTTGGVDPSREPVVINDQDKHAMQTALDYLRPVNTVPTFNPSFSTLRYQPWSQIDASSEYPQVVRFVTGSSSVQWPATDNTHWIVPGIEVEAPQSQAQVQAHYVGFHNVSNIVSYTDAALSDPNYATNSAILANYASVHVGAFPEMAPLMPYFNQFTDSSVVYSPARALADYAESLTVTNQTTDGDAYINNIYPADYITLQGVPDITYRNDHFWSSAPRSSGAEILEIDLGIPQAVNFISLEVSRKPVLVEVDFDLLDQAPARTFVPINLLDGPESNTYAFFEGAQNPWQYMEYYFNDGHGTIFTRFIRLVFTRQTGTFLYNQSTKTQAPWSIEARNLRIGRNVPPSVN